MLRPDPNEQQANHLGSEQQTTNTTMCKLPSENGRKEA